VPSSLVCADSGENEQLESQLSRYHFLKRRDLVLVRAAVAVAQAFLIGLIACLLIPLFSWATRNQCSLVHSVPFALFLTIGGVVFVSLSVFMSSLFEANTQPLFQEFMPSQQRSSHSKPETYTTEASLS
jgi:ABC-type sulfate transport system permease subunit